MHLVSSASARRSISRPERAVSKSGYRSRHEDNSMNETRRAFILAAGSAVAALSLPQAMAGAAGGVAGSDKGGQALGFRGARGLPALLPTRQGPAGPNTSVANAPPP